MNQTNQTNSNSKTSNSKKCSNIFLEEDGYCTRCGRSHFVECFGKVYFYQPDAINKEEKSSYVDMEGTYDQDALSADYDEKGKRIYTLIVTRTVDGIEKIETI